MPFLLASLVAYGVMDGFFEVSRFYEGLMKREIVKRASSAVLCCLLSVILPRFALADDASGGPAAEGASRGLAVTIVDSSVKVRPDTRLTADAAPRLSLAAARNEEESGQFVLFSKVAQAGLTLSVSDLKSAKGQVFPRTAITLLLAQQVRVAKASDSLGAAGDWPDPLVPVTAAFKLEAGKSQGFWVRVKVAEETAPGMYTGVVTVKSGTRELARIPLELEVWKAVLPATATLPTLAGLDYEMIARFEEVALTSPAFEAEVLPRYYRALRRNYVYPLFIYGARPAYRDDGEHVVLDMKPFWIRVDAALEEAKAWAPIGIPFSESWPVDTARYPLMSPEYQLRVRRYLTALARELDSKGALARSFIYLASADEPKSAAQIARIKQFAQLVRQADPRLRLLQTVHAHCEDCSGDAQAQLDHPSLLWAPNIAYFDMKAMREPKWYRSVRAEPSGWTPAVSARLKAERRDVWWYFNAWTFLLEKAPAYPSLFIDHPGIEHRAAAWLAFRNGIAGLGHWSATYWRNVSNPWKELPRGEGGAGTAGDGVLLYPAKGSSAATGQPEPSGPITSIRLELLREGAEDYALLELLRRRGGGAQAEKVTAELARSLSDFEHDPAKYRQARRRIAEALAQ